MAKFVHVVHGDETSGLFAKLTSELIADRFGIPHTKVVALQLDDGSLISCGKANPSDPELLVPVTSRLAQSQIDWRNAKKMELSGGTGGKTGEYEYIARPAIRIVSSAPVYNAGNSFQMGYLFEGSSAESASTAYWLTTSTGPQTLTFLFKDPVNIASIRVCTTAQRDCADRRSNYQISVATCDGQSRRVTDGFVDTSADVFGSFHTHKVQERGVIEILFNLTQEASFGVCLKKIEIWSVE
jgi:hypothetical protein